MEEILDKISEKPGFVKHPQVVEGYFDDMYMSMRSIHRSLKEGGKVALVVGNVCLPNITIDTDLILAELAEDIGFRVKEILVANARWCDVYGIRKERPVRESILIMEK
ncbi:MAG TPA: hypothetical protein ENG12_04205 [Candidatus Altiarchaeales archaeon]|nr:hypothetical protein [Candidatus Altiarchaeales archaeon]